MALCNVVAVVRIFGCSLLYRGAKGWSFVYVYFPCVIAAFVPTRLPIPPDGKTMISDIASKADKYLVAYFIPLVFPATLYVFGLFLSMLVGFIKS